MTTRDMYAFACGLLVGEGNIQYQYMMDFLYFMLGLLAGGTIMYAIWNPIGRDDDNYTTEVFSIPEPMEGDDA